MSQEIPFERSLYIGNLVGVTFFGIGLSLCIQSCTYLLKPGYRSQRAYFYASYCVLLMIFYAIALMSDILFGLFGWIEHRDSLPGGPAAYFGKHAGDWYNIFGTAACVALVFTADSLMLYRCYIVLGSRFWYIVVPGVTLLASTALGIVAVVASAAPQAHIFSGNSAAFGTAWTSLSAAYNVIVTAQIGGRVLYSLRQIKRANAITSDSQRVYTGVIALVIESALPYALSGIMLAVVFNKQSFSIGFSEPWLGFAAISPQLIILRIAVGSAWSKDTWSGVQSSLRFHHPSNVVYDESNTRVGEVEGRGMEPKFATHSEASM